MLNNNELEQLNPAFNKNDLIIVLQNKQFNFNDFLYLIANYNYYELKSVLPRLSQYNHNENEKINARMLSSVIGFYTAIIKHDYFFNNNIHIKDIYINIHAIKNNNHDLVFYIESEYKNGYKDLLKFCFHYKYTDINGFYQINHNTIKIYDDSGLLLN